MYYIQTALVKNESSWHRGSFAYSLPRKLLDFVLETRNIFSSPISMGIFLKGTIFSLFTSERSWYENMTEEDVCEKLKSAALDRERYEVVRKEIPQLVVR
jgi:hypothetical protein